MTVSEEFSIVVSFRPAPHGLWRGSRTMQHDERGHILKIGAPYEELVDPAGTVLCRQELTEEEFKILYPPCATEDSGSDCDLDDHWDE